MILHGSNLPSWYVISIFIVELYRDESILKWLLKHVRCSLGSWKRLVKWIQILSFPPFLNFRKWTKMGWHHRWWPNLAQTSQIWRFSRIFCAALATWFRLGKDSIRITVKSCQSHKGKTNLWQNSKRISDKLRAARSASTKILCASKLLNSTRFFNMLSMTSWPASRMLPYFGSPWPNRCFQEKRQLFGVWVSSASFETDMYIDPIGTTLPQNSMVKKKQMFL